MLKKWSDLPAFMQCDEVKEYYIILSKKKISLVCKRLFDIVLAAILLVVFLIPMIVIAFAIKIDSKGPVFYRQNRVTKYGRIFRIHKFRTMIDNADKMGTAVTVGKDVRITKVGMRIRDYRLDEIPQLLDVLVGNMSFVGTRPEAVKYVERYSKVMYATLLLPAGITSETSIRYKDEAKFLEGADDVDKIYVEKVLPEKMKYNLESVKKFSFLSDLATIYRTVFVVFFGRNK